MVIQLTVPRCFHSWPTSTWASCAGMRLQVKYQFEGEFTFTGMF
jgi:hypothetical protein